MSRKLPSGKSYDVLKARLQELTGFDEVQASEALASVLCALDQRLFYDAAMGFKVPIPLMHLLRRCEHHKGTQPRCLSKEGILHVISTDMQVSTSVAEKTLQKVLEALQTEFNSHGRWGIGAILPPDLIDLWPQPDVSEQPSSQEAVAPHPH